MSNPTPPDGLAAQALAAHAMVLGDAFAFRARTYRGNGAPATLVRVCEQIAELCRTIALEIERWEGMALDDIASERRRVVSAITRLKRELESLPG